MKRMTPPPFTMPNEITEATQIQILEQRIKELNRDLNKMKSNGPAFNHSVNSVSQSFGITDAEAEELSRIVRHWAGRHDGMSKVVEEIEAAPLSMREKLFMMFLLTMKCMQAGVIR